MAGKQYLFTPGPTPVPPEVLAALAEPIVHHRGPDYRAIFGEVLERLRLVFRTSNDVLVFTSSGTGAMESAVANLCSPGDRVVVVSADGVSSLGAVPLETDAWGIDVVCSGSQKALMTPPGLGLVSVSDAALAALGTSPRFYFDWERTRSGQAKLDSAFTPGVSLVRALNVALGLLLDEGLDAAFDRHVRLGRACREGAK